MSLTATKAPAAEAIAESASRRYVLRDELAAYSLPNSQREPVRAVAWTNVICACVLAVGLFGWQRTSPVTSVTPHAPDAVPVFLEEIKPPPAPLQQAFQAVEPSALDQPDSPPAEPPPIVPRVAAATASVEFAIPVEGPVAIVKELLKAAPPPRTPAPATAAPEPQRVAAGGSTKPTGPSKFSRGGFKGDFPDMQFEDFSKEFRLRNRGKALSARIQWELTPEGVATNFQVLKASESPEFEREVIRWMKRKYRFDPPGQPFVLFQDIVQSN